MITSILDINNHKIDSVPPTAYYVSEYITLEEEKTILSSIYSAPKPKWTQLANRRLQNWGGVPHSKGMIAEAIPTWLNTYLDKIHNLDVMEGRKPNHVLVNEYLSGQGIMAHLDGFLFYPTITTISVGSHTVLKFLQSVDDGGKTKLNHVFSLLLEPRSLLVLQEQMFTSYLHSIEEVRVDCLDNSIANLNMCSKNYCINESIKRATRISLTIRHVPKTSSFNLHIGNK